MKGKVTHVEELIFERWRGKDRDPVTDAVTLSEYPVVDG